MRFQQTVGRAISCEGVGLHSGQPARMTLRPAPPDTGIVFTRPANGHAHAWVGASVRNLIPTQLCTAIGVNGTQFKTIEHVLSALTGLEVDNVVVEVSADEVPVMDGSAGEFVRLIREAGVVPQDRRQPCLKVTSPIEVADGDRVVRIEPSTTPRISYSIHYPHPLIGTQSFTYDCSVASFEENIARARTFGFLKEVEALWARGLGKGGSLDNTVVLTECDILNESGLRYTDEFVRHKVLDLLGDLALLGVPIIGHLVAERSGHALHTKLVETILAQPDKWMLVNANGDPVAASPRPALDPAPHPSAVPLQVSPAL